MDGNNIYKHLGKKVAMRRKTLSKTQMELAYIAHVDRALLARIERGKANPTLRTLIKLARSMKTNLSDLIN